jgi:hypothetical protein
LLALCAGLITVWLASASEAAVVVNWGGDSVSTNVLFANPNGNNYGGFSGDDPLQISPTSSYTGGTFYGQVAWSETGSDGSYGQVNNSSSADRIEIKRYDTDLRAVILWKQADFLNGLSSGNVGFDATSTVSANIATDVNFEPGHVVVRLEGGAHDGYYISSQTPFDGSGDKSATFTSLTWLAYDPATSLTTFGSAVNLLSNATSGTIEHVTEVGFYARSNHASAANAFRVSTFQVSAAAVPEPATLTVLGAGAWMMLSARRRHKRTACFITRT